MEIVKQKPILPSLKEKRRYLAFEVISESKLSFSEVKEAILTEFKSLIGRLGMAKANMSFLDDWQENKGVIKVNNKYVDYVKASFVCLKKIGKSEACVRSLGVSGLLNKSRKNYIIAE